MSLKSGWLEVTWARWLGYAFSTVPVLLLLLSAYMKLSRSPQAVEGFAKMDYPAGALLWIGIAELTCTLLYVFPKTAVLGAMLLTGYLGGAVNHHVRMGESFLIPVLLGVLVWGGLFLRDRRVRALTPWREREAELEKSVLT